MKVENPSSRRYCGGERATRQVCTRTVSEDVVLIVLPDFLVFFRLLLEFHSQVILARK